MNQLIACCGLDCEKCDARIATITSDNAMRAHIPCPYGFQANVY